MLKACDEVCGKKKGRRDQGNTWWWNEDVKEAIARKMCIRRCIKVGLRRIRPDTRT